MATRILLLACPVVWLVWLLVWLLALLEMLVSGKFLTPTLASGLAQVSAVLVI